MNNHIYPIGRERVRITLLGMLLASWSCLPFAAERLSHPMDPLTASEYEVVVKVLHENNHVDSDTQYSFTLWLYPAVENRCCTSLPVSMSDFQPDGQDFVACRSFIVAASAAPSLS